MFSGWQTYYRPTGAASAQLVGLLFIVATLNKGHEQPRAELGLKLFTTPAVVHLATVLVVSALALLPNPETNPPCALMMLVAVLGLAYSLPIAVRIGRAKNPTHWSDFWLYGAAPAVVYLALAASAGAAVLRAPHAAYALGLVLLALLVVAIRNAWDLVTWLAPRRPEA